MPFRGIALQTGDGSLEPLDTTSDDSFGFTGSARVAYQTLKGSILLDLSQETLPVNGRQGSRDVTRASVEVTRRLLKKLTFQAGASHTLSRSTGEDPLDERSWSARSELSWQFSRRWSTFARYQHQRYSNDLPRDRARHREWTANRIGVGVRWAYDLPL